MSLDKEVKVTSYDKCCKCKNIFTLGEVRQSVVTEVCGTSNGNNCVTIKGISYWHHRCLFPQG